MFSAGLAGVVLFTKALLTWDAKAGLETFTMKRSKWHSVKRIWFC